jgi:hypothetical protein
MAGPPLITPPESHGSYPQSLEIASNIATLRAEVDQLKRSRSVKFATVLSIIATVISGATGGAKLWGVLVKRSRTVVTPGSALKMTYDPTRQVVKITFDLMLQNLGNKDDAIRELNGKISDPQTSSFAPLGANDFTCVIAGSTGPQQGGRIFSVPKEGSTSVVCVGSIRLSALS